MGDTHTRTYNPFCVEYVNTLYTTSGNVQYIDVYWIDMAKTNVLPETEQNGKANYNWEPT